MKTSSPTHFHILSQERRFLVYQLTGGFQRRATEKKRTDIPLASSYYYLLESDSWFLAAGASLQVNINAGNIFWKLRNIESFLGSSVYVHVQLIIGFYCWLQDSKLPGDVSMSSIAEHQLSSSFLVHLWGGALMNSLLVSIIISYLLERLLDLFSFITTRSLLERCSKIYGSSYRLLSFITSRGELQKRREPIFRSPVHIITFWRVILGFWPLALVFK